jgi:phosphonate transport system substrate-binding protein
MCFVKKSSRLVIALTGLWAATAAITSAAAQDKKGWPDKLMVSAIPDVAANRMLTQYEPIATYLSKKLGIPVEFVPVTDYQATVTGLAKGQLHLVWYGGYTSVQADHETKGNIERLVMREEDKKFKSVFITQPNSEIKSLKDLKGKTFTFGSESSTSGHLMPRYFLLQNKIDPSSDFDGPPAFQKNHDATIQAVQGGTVAAGALNFLVWDRWLKEGKVDASKVAVFWTSPEFVDYNWTVRKDTPESLKKAIKSALLSLDASKPDDKVILDLQSTKKYVEAHDADWKKCEEAARAAGMLKDQ